MDQVNPNPPKEVVAYPERCDDSSNQPLPDSIIDTKEDSSQIIVSSETPKKSSSVQSSRKRSAGKKRPLSKPLPPPDLKSPKLDQTTSTQQVAVHYSLFLLSMPLVANPSTNMLAIATAILGLLILMRLIDIHLPCH